MYHTTWQPLLQAVDALATGEGRIQGRLKAALNSLTPLRAPEFPNEIQAPFSSLFSRLSGVPDPQGRGTIDVFVDSLTEREASAIASEIVSWFDTVAREHCS